MYPYYLGRFAMITNLFVLLISYLIGSIPTAVLVSRARAGKDIREMGDGNMGARNTTHVMGWRAGTLVAVIDFCKGMLVVLLMHAYNPSLDWQLLAGICAVLGHDFPVFASFKGGQGMATTLGVLIILIPVEALVGLACFGVAYLLWRNFDLSAGLGLGTVAFLVWRSDQPTLMLWFTIVLFLAIPAKKVLDWPRRRRLARQQQDMLESANADQGR
jgi:acyl phosphate:glycerol-3-phosphate acyltransferase